MIFVFAMSCLKPYVVHVVIVSGCNTDVTSKVNRTGNENIQSYVVLAKGHFYAYIWTNVY